MQGQRVARSLGENPFGHAVTHHREPAPQQFTGRADVQGGNQMPAGPPGGELPAGGGQHHRAGAVQPARDELHDVETRLVQPMRVVDDQQYRPGRRRRPEQAEHEHAHADRVGGPVRPGIEVGTEEKAQRVRLLGRKRGEFGPHRQQHPAQATERDDVGRPPGDRFSPEHAVSVIESRIRGDLEQGGEPDPWFSGEHQAAAGANLSEEPLEHGDLGVPPDQHGGLLRRSAIWFRSAQRDGRRRGERFHRRTLAVVGSGSSPITIDRTIYSAVINAVKMIYIPNDYLAVPDAQRVLPPAWIVTLASAWSTRTAPAWPSVRVLQTVAPVPMLASTRLPSS